MSRHSSVQNPAMAASGVRKKSSIMKAEPRASFFMGAGAARQGGLMPDRRGTQFGDRRVTQGESPLRAVAVDKSHKGSLAVKNRGRVLHEVRVPDTFNGLYSVRFSPAGDTIVTSFGAGAIQVRDPVNGELKGTLRSAMDQASPVMCLRYHPTLTDEFYAASACGTVFKCNAGDGQFTRYLQEPKNEINALDINVTGDLLATGGKDAHVRVYDINTAKLLSLYRKRTAETLEKDVNQLHSMRVFALRCHPMSRNKIITGGWDDTVKIWDVRVPDGCVLQIRGPHICGDAIDIKDRTVLTGSWVVSGSLQTWDISTGKLIQTVVPINRPTTLDGEFLYTAQFFKGDPNGDIVCIGGSGTGAVEVISLREKRVLGCFRVNKAVQALDTYQNTLCYGGMETLLRIGEFF